MATHEYTRTTNSVRMAPGTSASFSTNETFSVPFGQTFTEIKLSNPLNTDVYLIGNALNVWQAKNWNTYSSSNVSSVWSNGGKCNFTAALSGSASSYATITFTVTFKTTDIPTTAVTSGNKIKATDFTQAGGSATAGNIIKLRDGFTAGTKATAAKFNSDVLKK